MNKSERAICDFAKLRGIELTELEAQTFLLAKAIAADPESSAERKKTAALALESFSEMMSTKRPLSCFACLILQGELIDA